MPSIARARLNPIRFTWARLRALLLAALLCGALLPFARPAPAQTQAPTDILTYLPIVRNSDPFAALPPIWTFAGIPSTPSVALFRAEFTALADASQAHARLFADTRYEAWLDGRWVGRGPARFSASLKEYDILPLGALSAGKHVLAVLVQFAPNTRRSESTAPLLMGDVSGLTPAGWQTYTSSGPSWRALPGDAWRSDAAPMDTRRLIGPTELLDFNRLPLDWQAPGYNSASWASPVLQTSAAYAEFRPRSIPLTVNVPITPTLQRSGMLSPQRWIGQLAPPLSLPYAVTFRAETATSAVVEVLAAAPPQNPFVKLDGTPLAWSKVSDQRPDVYQAPVDIKSGKHTLTFLSLPPEGLVFSLTRQNLTANLPFQSAPHAGQRGLLAEYVDDPSAVSVVTGTLGWDVAFNHTPAFVILDLGRTIHGRLSAVVDGPTGSVVDIGWDEWIRQPTNRPLPYMGSLYPYLNYVDSWTLDGASRSLSTIDARAGRYVVIAAWGSGPVRLRSLQVIEERYPTTQLGQFHASDPLLERIWQVGVDTLRPNMIDAYTDTPVRERGQWWGDAYVTNRINQVVFGDQELLRRGLYYMADAMQTYPAPGKVPNNENHHMLDYSMLWAIGLGEQMQTNGDEQLASRLYPSLQAFMAHLHSLENPTTGLLDLPQVHWSQNGYIDTYGAQHRFGQSTAMNSLYIESLRQAARVASRLNDTAQAGEWNTRADERQTALNDLLYDSVAQRYLTRRYPDNDFGPTALSQAFPLAYQLYPSGQQSTLGQSLLDLLPMDPHSNATGPYGMFWVLEGLGKNNRLPEAVEIIRTYYGHMLDAGATTWWEGFDSDEHLGSSFSHAWSAAPTYFLTTYVLGARVVAPGAWLWQPPLADAPRLGLTEADGVLPVQGRLVRLGWKTAACGQARLWVNAPPGLQATLTLPFPAAALAIQMDGTPAQAAPGGDSLSVISLPDHDHIVDITYPCRP